MSLHIRQQAIAEAEAEHSSSDAETHHSSDDEEDIPRPLRFSAECPLLPPSRSIDFPHIIQISDYDPAADLRDLTFPDIIATFLWHWDRVQFYKFFDMSRNHFELHYRAPRASGRDMVISRNGRGVMVSR
ncbi:hypothetical protein DOTSEDRAFT_72848 [Dothistroma septosporum NZE10]|uniref:Uncharacterized protein n=1 Tax=Dothistroma septosporum (strain NZE10 / CBS 128990) TaxID=675120 RepID=M2WNM2_DOTSN|nr:hypothetical protein DOTSEDRAFT_72848 [Dothistroma septosporum NZE10]